MALLRTERHVEELRRLTRTVEVQSLIRLMGMRLADLREELPLIHDETELRWCQGRIQELTDWLAECEKMRGDT